MVEPHPVAETVHWAALVRLRVSMPAADAAAARLPLPSALRSSRSANWLALWIAPDQWLIASERDSAREVLDRCSYALDGILHLAVDVSAALDCLRFPGAQGRALLAMGSGLDWSASATPAGCSIRTRLARIPAIVHVVSDDRIDVYVDRSHRDYFERWIGRSASDPLLRERACPNTY